ncbi:MAG: sporulation protein YunB [Christensenellaceae bacterium]|jgi:sporulation protein YunB|nr:sporulation protein YunB [Christensenellaceae bacterium]
MKVKQYKRKLKKIKFLLILSLIIFSIYFYFDTIVFSLVIDIAESQAKSMALEAINEAGTLIRSLEGFFGDYYDYKVNNEGEVVLITANAANINKMHMTARSETQRALNKLNTANIIIPMGAFSGSSIFADMGPPINLKISLVATSETIWNSYFYNEGINQTIHRLILRISTKLNIIIPIKASDVFIEADFIIAEDIILGRVPDSYIDSLDRDNVFDLIP